jgi:hypothetical protein
MAIIEIQNRIAKQISTTIGTIIAGEGIVLKVQIDQVPIPKQLYEELEGLRLRGSIFYDILEDEEIRDEVEAAPFFSEVVGQSPIGTPTDGDYTDGKLPLTSTTKVSDAIDLINVELLGVSGSSEEIGTPTSGDYTNGFFDDWIPTTKIPDALQEISDSFLDLAPVKADVLTGQNLILSGTTQYSAKIPTGLSTAWDPLTPGSIITNLIIDNIYRLDTPDLSTRFRAGKDSDPSTAGILTHVEDTVSGATYNIGVNGIGVIGIITIDALDTYNTFWLKANAHIDFTQSTEGRKRHALNHDEAGISNEIELYYDDINTAPSFSVAMSATINTIVSKYLSGIEAAGFGTTIDIAYTAASGIFNKTYHPTNVGQVSGSGHITSNDNPGVTPAVADTFPVSRTLTLDIANQSNLNPQYTATLRKPNGDNASSVDSISKSVNTYGTVSTTKTDLFFDEAQRIVLGSGTSSITAITFNSANPLVNGNAQQRHNGVLQYPDATDYPTFSGDQEYERFISKPTASVGQLTFNGIVYTDIDAYSTGDLNILLELATEGIYFDFGKSIGDNNGTGSGNSRANSIGARNDLLSTGSTLAWSIGVKSTSGNTNEYRLIIIFRNTNHTVNSISEI